MADDMNSKDARAAQPRQKQKKPLKKEKHVKLPTVIIAAVIIIAVIMLLNPQLIPFITDDARDAINAFLGDFASSGGAVLTLPHLTAAGIAIICTLAVNRIVMFAIGRIKPTTGRSRTMLGVARSVVNYSMLIIGALLALAAMGIDVSGLFAGIGIVSLIVGFGAQSLIEDVITGFFIIFEGQYNVGDIIVLDGFRGEVRKIGVRTTTLEDTGGNIKIVNNSDVRNLQNRSAKPSSAVCDVSIGYSENLENVEKIINDALPQITAQANGMFLKPVQYAGVQQLADSGIVLRFTGTINERDIFDAQRYLNRAVKLLFDKNGINIPYPQIDVHQAK